MAAPFFSGKYTIYNIFICNGDLLTTWNLMKMAYLSTEVDK